MDTELRKRFDQAMWDCYYHAKREARYLAVQFLQMLETYGGYETARILINSSTVSEGYDSISNRCC